MVKDQNCKQNTHKQKRYLPKNFHSRSNFVIHSGLKTFSSFTMTSLVADVTKDANSRVHVVFEEEDLAFEEELLRNPHSLKSWLRYIEAREDAPSTKVNMLYERALKELPGSYKLWYRYLRVRRLQGKFFFQTEDLTLSKPKERLLQHLKKLFIFLFRVQHKSSFLITLLQVQLPSLED